MATKEINEKTLNYYLNLPWTYTVEQARDGKNKKIYIIRVNELPGVVTDAPSLEKGFENIKEAMILAFEMYLESGEEIPEPAAINQYRGHISYRTSPLRHHLIAQEARKQNQSLSKFIDILIDTALTSKKK